MTYVEVIVFTKSVSQSKNSTTGWENTIQEWLEVRDLKLTSLWKGNQFRSRQSLEDGYQIYASSFI